MTETYVMDTYAVAEILRKNKNYCPYLEKSVILTQWNIFEIYYTVARDYGKEKAQQVVDLYYPSVIAVQKSILEEAAFFRLEQRQKDLSMTDCIGYILARRIGIKFLTGDIKFENLPNVEWVK